MNLLTIPVIVEKRLEICTKCEYRAKFLLASTCVKCGCIISAKVRIPTATCPVGKW